MEWLDQHPAPRQRAVTIGFFDGVHRGHQALIRRTIEHATAHGWSSAALTFFPHPREVLEGLGPFRYLTPLAEKMHWLRAMGLDEVLAARFTPALAALTPFAFVAQVLHGTLSAQVLVVGPDFRFGARRAGDVGFLQTLAPRLGFTVDVVDEVRAGETRLSSTAIRNALAAGDLPTVATFLGRPYTLTGTVVEGQRLGREIGFPTANLALDPRKLLPPDGVYAVAVFRPDAEASGDPFPLFPPTWGGQERLPSPHGQEPRRGVLNIGRRPTVDGTTRTVEVHLLDFAGHLYGQTLTVAVLVRLREERKFPGLAELRAAMAEDVRRAQEVPLQFEQTVLQ